MRDFEAGDLGQLDFHEDQVRPVAAGEIDRLDAALRLDRRVAMGFQQIVEKLHVELVILDDEHGFGHGYDFASAGPVALRVPPGKISCIDMSYP